MDVANIKIIFFSSWCFLFLFFLISFFSRGFVLVSYFYSLLICGQAIRSFTLTPRYGCNLGERFLTKFFPSIKKRKKTDVPWNGHYMIDNDSSFSNGILDSKYHLTRFVLAPKNLVKLWQYVEKCTTVVHDWPRFLIFSVSDSKSSELSIIKRNGGPNH